MSITLSHPYFPPLSDRICDSSLAAQPDVSGTKVIGSNYIVKKFKRFYKSKLAIFKTQVPECKMDESLATAQQAIDMDKAIPLITIDDKEDMIIEEKARDILLHIPVPIAVVAGVGKWVSLLF